MLQVYFEKKKINYNLKIIRLYQPINSKNQSFKYEWGKLEI